MNNFFTRFKNFLYFRTNIRIFSVTKDSLSNYKSTINFKLIKIKNYKEIEGLSENHLVKKNLNKFKYFLDNGCSLFFAIYENRVIGHFLSIEIAKFRPYPYLNTSSFDGNNYYIFFCRTDNKHRGKGVYPDALIRIVKDNPLPEKYLISTDKTNKSSIKGIIKAGFIRVVDLDFRNIFGITINDNLS